MSVRSLRYNTIEQHFTKSALASTDRDALAFLEAAQIYNANQQRAIVNLVRSLKRVGLWSKMKAIYPFVGGTASSHKWNLKDPRDADAAFRLNFVGGWTHNSNGALANGVNIYADTFFTPSSNSTENSFHCSFYSRTSAASTGVEIGLFVSTTSALVQLVSRYTLSPVSDKAYFSAYRIADQFEATNTDGSGYYIGTRTANNAAKFYKNNTTLASSTATASGFGNANLTLYIGARNQDTGPNQFSNKQCAFATIGDGLTDTDSTNLYNIVQRYQFQLGRAIEPDAQAFIDAAGITDATQQAAILDLVVRLKNDGLWSKMKAIYPFVGGTATSHKFNLKDPRDADAAFRLTFSGGWTHASTGALPNGTSAYADTKLIPSSELPLADHHASIYLRNNTIGTNLKCDLGSYNTVSVDQYLVIYARFIDRTYMVSGDNTFPFFSNTDSTGFYLLAKSANTTLDGYKNTSKNLTGASTSTTGGTRSGVSVYLGARNAKGTATDAYSDREVAFASLGNDLTDTDATNFYNIVDLYQKRLGRAV